MSLTLAEAAALATNGTADMVATPPRPASCLKNCRRLFSIVLESDHRSHVHVIIVWLVLTNFQENSKYFLFIF
jgi:hypothetical protein